MLRKREGGRAALLMWSESPGELSAPDTIILCGPRVIQQRTGVKAAKESAAPTLATSRYTLDVTKARAAAAHSCFCPEPGKVRRQKVKDRRVGRGESGERRVCNAYRRAELRNRCAGCDNPFSPVWGGCGASPAN